MLKIDKSFADKSKKWAILDSYYVPTRYPNSIPDSILARITRDYAIEAVKMAEEIVEFVKKRIHGAD